MKTVTYLLIALMLLNLPLTAKAGFYDSDYFEPTLGCAIGGAVGYSSTKTDQALNAGLYCLGGIALGLIVNSYYRKKVDAVHERELAERSARILRKKVELANSATLGDTNRPYAIEAEQIEDAQQMPDGTVIAPSRRTILETP